MKKYRVSGRCAVFGTQPGKTFEREISPAQEARLIKAGHIKPVDAPVSQGESKQPVQGTAAVPASGEQKESK